MLRIGRFTVVRELGHGGMGSVYLAQDPELQRDVAIKLLHRTSAGVSSARAQFREEARALARMSHPGIVTIFEIGEHEEQQFIAMEYLRGRSLRELLSSAPPPRERMLAICGEVARAVDAAHGRGILHRDIKPENVVVLDDGGVKVVDFGLARRLDVRSLPTGATLESLDQVALDETVRMLTEADAEATQNVATLRGKHTVATQGSVAGTLFGTPAYMAPEVLHGRSASKASDIYSLGVMLFECLAGKRPYEAASLVELIAIVVDSTAPPPIDDPLAPLVAAMLDPDPDHRPSLGEIANTLAPTATTSGQVISLPPPVARRSRAPLFAVVGAVIAIAAGIAIWQHRSHDPPSARIVVAPIPSVLSAWSSEGPLESSIATVIAQLIARDNLAAIAPPRRSSSDLEKIPFDAASDVSATHVVRGRIVQQRDAMVAVLELHDAHGRFVIPFVARDDPKQLPAVLADLSDRIVLFLDPDATVGQRPDRMRAAQLYQAGRSSLEQGSWYQARLFLEQAVQLDPDSGDAWRYLASARGWTVAPSDLMEQAIGNAIRLERDPKKRQVWLGAMHFYRDEQPQAIEILAPLIARTDFTAAERIDLWNYLGEAYWHDGSPELGAPYLQKVFGSGYSQVRPHVYDHALYHGEFDRASSIYGMQRNPDEVTFARGRHEELARRPGSPYDVYAQLVLGEEPDPAAIARLQGRAPAFFALARATDRETFLARFGELRADLDRSPTPSIWDAFGVLAELAIVAEQPDAVRQILEMQQLRGPQPFRGYRRNAILAAGVLREPTKLSRDHLTSREAKLATAIESELAGDHARAIEILRPIVREPMATWGYAERAALIRNLGAAGRSKELAEECALLARPTLFRWAWLPLARTCKRLTAQPGRTGRAPRPARR